MVKRFAFAVLILFLAVTLLLVVVPATLAPTPLVVGAFLAFLSSIALADLGSHRSGAESASPRSPPRA